MNRATPAIRFQAISAAVLTLTALTCQPVSAQSAGAWLFKAGINTITPEVRSGDLSAPSLPGTRIDIKSASAPIISATYMLTDNWSAEAFAGLPYKHEVVGDGAVKGVGRLGSVKQISPTALLQYRFLAPAEQFRPYLGAGLSYGHFFATQGSAALTALTQPGTTATRMKVDDAFGLSVQIGASFKLNERWFIDAAAIKTFIKTTTTLSTGQKIDTKLDPLATNVSVGYRF